MLVLLSLPGLEWEKVTYGPATITVSGRGPGPTLTDKLRYGYTVWRLSFFSICIEERDQGEGLVFQLRMLKVTIVFLSLGLLSYFTLTYRRAYRAKLFCAE
jgi:hypothetical protein